MFEYAWRLFVSNSPLLWLNKADILQQLLIQAIVQRLFTLLYLASLIQFRNIITLDILTKRAIYIHCGTVNNLVTSANFCFC